MRCNPFAKSLLGILSLIPDGIHVQQLERFKGIFVEIDILSSLQVLQQCGLINLLERDIRLIQSFDFFVILKTSYHLNTKISCKTFISPLHLIILKGQT
jgi:hypothetical protein